MNRKTQSSPGTLKQNGVHLQEHEFFTIKVLPENGYNIELIPPSTIKGVYIPDVLINGTPWEIKAPEGAGKNTIKHRIQNALFQSRNIILDLRRCKLERSIAIKKAEREFYQSKRAQRMKIIINTPNSCYQKSGKKTAKDYAILDFTKE